ncbi:MAG: M28 family metallopeptidase [Isosphaeraceae bacterium]
MRRPRILLPTLSVSLILTVLAAAGMDARASASASAGDGDPTGGPPAPAIGFSTTAFEKQHAAEARALTVPTPENARRWLGIVTAEPHVAGTPADHKTAIFVRDKLREWGWKADLVELEVLLNYPVDRPSLTLSAPKPVNLPVDEAPIATDKDSASSKAFGAFNGYGASGFAAGQVVYVNYGRPEDYSALEKMGMEIRDKIVLVRYGEIFRGLKVYNAQKRGAKGILIFSDPADDGFAKGDTYPNGRFRPETAIQRGSVQFLSHGPGDPSTPFGPSIPGAPRLPMERFAPEEIVGHVGYQNPFPIARGLDDWEKQTGLKLVEYYATIPSLPISYGTAMQILKVLAGPNAPAGWQGGLPLAYHTGPGPAEVQFSIRMDYRLRKIWNVLATIPGTEEPDRWIMMGNHRDAWVYGAVDPGSGTAATLETCRAIGDAVKHGWKPRRTLVYASWDAEEYGLVGSTEWAEAKADELKKKAVLMLNVDSAVSGPTLGLGGIPSLRDFVVEAAGSITDVRTGKTLGQTWTDEHRAAWANASPLILEDPAWSSGEGRNTGKSSRKPDDHSPQMSWLGSGSDYTAFVDHLGIPAVDAGLRGGYGVYHSIYDDFNWMDRFGDPEFLSHATAARFYTLITMRAAGAEVVPMRFAPYGLSLRQHVDELRLIRARKLRKANGPQPSPGAEFDGAGDLIGAVREFRDRAEECDRAVEAAAHKGGIDRARLAELNDAIAAVERAFLLDEGLPGRPWFKHAVYAPGFTTGYASWPLPAIRQAIEDDKPGETAKAVAATVKRIRAASDALNVVIGRARAAVGAGP